MPYLGNAPSAAFQSVAYQDLTGGTGTSFTLSHAVSSAQEIEVFVNNVRQEPTVAYTAVGTTLTMTGTIAATDDFYVVFQGKAVGSVSHPTTSPLAATTGNFTGAVTATSFSGDGSALTGVSAGKVLQVLQTVDTTPVTASTSAGWNDLGSLSVAITPSSASSKIMIECHIGQFDHSNNTHIFYLKYVRGSTDIGIGDAAGSRIRATTSVRGDISGDGNGNTPVLMPKFLDSPSTTSATTYKVQFNNYNGGAYYYLRSASDADGAAHGRFIATLTATEIGA